MDELGVLQAIINSAGVAGVLLIVAYYQKKDKEKADADRKEERKNAEADRKEEMRLIRQEHQKDLEAQRTAHKNEKDEFFSSLKLVLKELIDELKIANDSRIRIIDNLDSVRIFQNDVRNSLAKYDTDLSVIKATLLNNSQILSTLLGQKLDTKGLEKITYNGENHELKRKFEKA